MQRDVHNVTQHVFLIAEAWRLKLVAGKVSLCRSDRCQG